jgi:hypothetical protein
MFIGCRPNIEQRKVWHDAVVVVKRILMALGLVHVGMLEDPNLCSRFTS